MRIQLLSLALLSVVAPFSTAQSIDRNLVKPGLVFTSTPTPGLAQLVPAPALNLAPAERAHPQLPPSESYSWLGTLNIVQAGSYRFELELLGEASVKLGEQVLVQGTHQGPNAKRISGPPIQLTPGIQQLRIQLNPAKAGARLELIWRGPGFETEPIPYFFFGHVASENQPELIRSATIDRGRFLVEEHGCVNCHRPKKDSFSLVPRQGNNLSNIAARTNAAWLDTWLKNPHDLRPQTNMPGLFTEDDQGNAERYAVVQYLLTLGRPREPRPDRSDELRRSIQAGSKLYQTIGCSTCHGDQLTSPPTKAAKDDLEEEEKPTYAPHEQFYSLGDATVGRYYQLGHVGSKWQVDQLAQYLRDPQALNAHGRMPSLNLSNDEARDLARFLVRQKDDTISNKQLVEPKLKPSDVGGATWATAGKAIFSAKGCANCHKIDGDDAPKLQFAKPLEDTARNNNAGCVAEKPNHKVVPNFHLNEADRAAVQTFLATWTTEASPSPMYQAKATLKRYGCLNCHNRDGEGGLSEDLERIMKSLSSAEQGEDLVPPRLTHAGHKLRTSWLKEVLLNRGQARPWMALRMPQYGEQHVGRLVEGLPKLEGTSSEETTAKPTYTASLIDAGRKLTGKEGMGCIACHDISGVSGGGTRGPDLARTQDRVRYDWFVRWMHQPQRLAPGTKMPQNFIDGKSFFPQILDGQADQQIEALWAYYSLGPGLPLPIGLEPPKGLTVAVSQRPEILRTFMPDDAGTRPIAVGFPGGTNAVFDSASCRLSYAWAGNFLDATPVWKDRGGNRAKLLGNKFWAGPAGFPWALAADGVVPNFSAQFKDVKFGYQLANDAAAERNQYLRFENYTVDDDGLPTFHYLLDRTNQDDKPGAKLHIAERLEALPTTLAPGLLRTFQLKSSAATEAIWFYISPQTSGTKVLKADGKPATAEHGQLQADATRLMIPEADGKLTLLQMTKVPTGAEWYLNGQEILLRIPPTTEVQTMQFKLWVLPKNDPVLLEGLK